MLLLVIKKWKTKEIYHSKSKRKRMSFVNTVAKAYTKILINKRNTYFTNSHRSFTLTRPSFASTFFPVVILLKTPRRTYLGRSLTLISFMSVSRDLTGARTAAKKNFFIIVSQLTLRSCHRSIIEIRMLF